MIYIPISVAAFLVIAYLWWRDHQRIRSLLNCARQRNLRFTRHDWLGVHRRYGEFVLIRAGHGHRAWHVFNGIRGQGLWIGFYDSFDVGSGGDRVRIHRCAAVIESPTGMDAVFLPAQSTDQDRNLLFTPMTISGFEVYDAGMPEATHLLYLRRPSMARHPASRMILTLLGGYPRDWAWEIRDHAILAVSFGEQSSETMAALLDAVVQVGNSLKPAAATNLPGYPPVPPCDRTEPKAEG